MRNKKILGNKARRNRMETAAACACILFMLMVASSLSTNALFIPDEGQNGDGDFWWDRERELEDENDQWGPQIMNADYAWDLDDNGQLSNPGKNSVVVAVIDTGIQVDHEDLEGMIWENPRDPEGIMFDDGEEGMEDGRPGREGVNEDGDELTDEDHWDLVPADWPDYDRTENVELDDDENGWYDDVNGVSFCHPTAPAMQPTPRGTSMPEWTFHGTRVAGIVAATVNNSLGIAGMAQVSLMSLQVCDGDIYNPDEYIPKAIEYAIEHDVDIIQLSIGDQEVPDAAYVSAISDAYDHGILIVSCSGNINFEDSVPNTDVWYPARDPNVISVGALTVVGPVANLDIQVADYSCYEDGYVEMVAPGGDGGVEGEDPDKDRQIFSTHDTRNVRYNMGAGTSFAAPHVTGVAALVWSIRPDLSHHEVREILRAACHDIGGDGFDATSGYGWLDADRAITIARNYQSSNSFDDPTQIELCLNENMELAMDVDSYGATHFFYTADYWDAQKNPNQKEHLRYTMINRNGKEYPGADEWITVKDDFLLDGDVIEPDVYIDYENRIHITFIGDVINGIGDVFYAIRDFNGAPLQTPVRITQNNQEKHSPRIVGNRNGETFVVWSQEDVGPLEFVVWSRERGGLEDYDLWIAGYSNGNPQNPFVNQKLFDRDDSQTNPDIDVWWDKTQTKPFIEVMWLDARAIAGNNHIKLFWLRYDMALRQIDPTISGDGEELVKDPDHDITEFSMCTEYFVKVEDPIAPRAGTSHFVWITDGATDQISYGKCRYVEPILEIDRRNDYYIGDNQPHDLSIDNCLNGDTYVQWIEDDVICIQKTVEISPYLYPVIYQDYQTIISGPNLRESMIIIENDDPSHDGNNPYLNCDERIRICWVEDWEVYNSGQYLTSRPLWHGESPLSNDFWWDDDDVADPDVAFSSDGKMHVVYSYYNGIHDKDMIRYQIYGKGTVESGTPNPSNAQHYSNVNSQAGAIDALKPKIRTYYDKDAEQRKVQIIWLEGGNDAYEFYGRTYDNIGNPDQANPVALGWFINDDNFLDYDFDINDDTEGYYMGDTYTPDRNIDDDRLYVVYVNSFQQGQFTYIDLEARIIDSDLDTQSTESRRLQRTTSGYGLLANPSVRVDMNGSAYLVFEDTGEIILRKLNQTLTDEFTPNRVTVTSQGTWTASNPDITLDRPIYPNDRGMDPILIHNRYHNDSREDQKVHIVWTEMQVEASPPNDVDHKLKYRCLNADGEFLSGIKDLIKRECEFTDGINENMGAPQIITDYQNNIHILVETDLFYFYSGVEIQYNPKIYYLKLDTIGNQIISEEFISYGGITPVVEIKQNDEVVAIWEDNTDTIDYIMYKSHSLIKN